MNALVRLTPKGLATRTRIGRAYSYSLAAAAEELPALHAAIRKRMQLDSRQQRAHVLANFLPLLGQMTRQCCPVRGGSAVDDGAHSTRGGACRASHRDRAVDAYPWIHESQAATAHPALAG